MISIQGRLNNLTFRSSWMWTLLVFAFGWMLISTSHALTITFLPLYLRSITHLDLFAISAALAIVGGFTSVFQIFGGKIFDRYSTDHIFTSSLAIRTLSYFGLSAAVSFNSGIVVIMGIWCIETACGSVFISLANAYVASVSLPEDQNKAFSILRISRSMSWTIGPSIANLAIVYEPGTMMILPGLITSAALALLFWILRKNKDYSIPTNFSESNQKGGVVKKTLGLHSVLGAATFLCSGMLIVPFTIYAAENSFITSESVSYLYAMNTVVILALQIPLIWRIRPKNNFKIMIASGIFQFLGFGLMWISQDFAYLSLAFAFVATAGILYGPSSLSLVSMFSMNHNRGSNLGKFGFFSSIGWSSAPAIGIFLLSILDTSGEIMWLYVASVSLLVSLCYTFLWWKNKSSVL